MYNTLFQLKTKNKIHHTVGTIPKYNRRNRDNMDTPKHTYMTTHSPGLVKHCNPSTHI